MLSFLFLVSLCSCHQEPTQHSETNILQNSTYTTIPQNNAYINETYHYSIEIPEIIDQNCDIRSMDNRSEIDFLLKGTNDLVMAILTIPTQKYTPLHGRIQLYQTNEYTICLQLPTCGTLENENSRKLHNQLVEEAKKITPQAIHLLR